MSNTTNPPTPPIQPVNHVPTQAPGNQTTYRDPDKVHYENLISFFKYAVTIGASALAIMASAAAYFTYSSVKDSREDIKSSMKDIKDDIEKIKGEAITTIRGTRDEVDKQANVLNAQVNKQVYELNKQVKEQIPLIKENAENLALSAVRKSINEQFEASNIRELISTTADRKLQSQVGGILNQKIQSATRDVDEQAKALARLSIAVDQIRAGDRRWFDTVENMSKYHKLPIIRELAATMLKQKINDYKVAFGSYNPTDSIIELPTGFATATLAIMMGNGEKKEADHVIEVLVKTIITSKDLNAVSKAYKALNFVVGKNFEYFNSVEVNEWYRNTYPKEKKQIEQRATKFYYLE
jgi:hypothetical protein